MLKQLVNECIIDLEIMPDGPILIKSGIPTLSGTEMAFVTTWRDGEPQVYLPGSSLKGVLRSHAERITRSVKLSAACNPFSKIGDHSPDTFCGNIFEELKDKNQLPKEKVEVNPYIYQNSCLICRVFGSTWYVGRLATEDAYAEGRPPRPQQRDCVGIDRFTGGSAHGAKFDLEVVTEGVFVTHLHLRNFELWQLGMLGFVLKDLEDGLVRIGAAKSRGLGKVCGKVRGIRLDFLGPLAPKLRGNGSVGLRGVGALVDEKTARDYGMASPDEVVVTSPPLAADNGVRISYRFDNHAFPWSELGDNWVQQVKQYQTPVLLRRFRGGEAI